MNSQFDTTAPINLDQDILRDLLDSEIVMIGGGEAAGTAY